MSKTKLMIIMPEKNEDFSAEQISIFEERLIRKKSYSYIREKFELNDNDPTPT